MEELFQDLRLLPGDAAIEFNDTQKINYMLGALRHEKEWDGVSSYITSRQIQGDFTFLSACNELRVRCEAARVHSLLDRPVTNTKVRGYVAQVADPPLSDASLSVEDYASKMFALVSTMAMKHNSDNPGDTTPSPGKKKPRKPRPSFPCLAQGCTETTPFPLCGTHYHALISGKHATVDLINQYGSASYNSATQLVVYPSKVPASRMPSNVRKVNAAAAVVPGTQ